MAAEVDVAAEEARDWAKAVVCMGWVEALEDSPGSGLAEVV